MQQGLRPHDSVGGVKASRLQPSSAEQASLPHHPAKRAKRERDKQQSSSVPRACEPASTGNVATLDTAAAPPASTVARKQPSNQPVKGPATFDACQGGGEAVPVGAKRKKRRKNKFKNDCTPAPDAAPVAATTSAQTIAKQSAGVCLAATGDARSRSKGAENVKHELGTMHCSLSDPGAAACVVGVKDRTAATPAQTKGLLGRMRQQLDGGRFRMLNERLYTTSGHQALEQMQV